MLRYRLLIEWCVLLVGACLFAFWAQKTNITERIDRQLLDTASTLARPAPTADTVLVAIDQTSLDTIGSWPWSRETHAQLIDRLSAAGAQQIIYDVLLVDRTEPEADARLAQAIASAGNVVLPHTFTRKPNTVDGIAPLYPLPEFSDPAQAIGHVSAAPDSDGLLRRFAFELQDDDRSYQQMMVAAHLALAKQQGIAAEVPNMPAADWPIVPFNPSGSFTTVLASNVLEGRSDTDAISGKIVIVGAVALGLGDRYSVSSDEVTFMPGVETQANLLSSLRSGQFVEEASFLWEFAFICMVVLLQFVAFWRFPPKSSLLVTMLLIASVLAFSIVSVPLAKFWIAPGTALLILLLSYPLWSWRRLVSVSKFLEVEAQKLPEIGEGGKAPGGFDVIARQVDRMRNLVRNVSDSFHFLKRTIETAPDPIIVLDGDGRVSMWNEKAASLFPSWKLSDEPLFTELFSSDRIHIDQASREIRTADDRTFLLARGKFANEDGDEPVSGEAEVLVLREVSEQRRQQRERQETLEFLSHDMRNPQVAIIGLAQRHNGPDDAKDRFGRIKVQAERTLKLAEDFVQLARLEETSFAFEETDLVALVQEACDRAYIMSRDRNVAIDQALPDSDLYAEVEPSMIARLLDNLLGNALKFSAPGTVVTVSVGASTNDEFTLKVSDRGPGLPPERQSNPFARFGAHNERAGPSAGLGLTFVQRAVEKHHGRIEVESESGAESGTAFIMHFPKQQVITG